MTTESAYPRHSGRRARGIPPSLDALARRKGARPVQSIHDLADPDIFETDEELDEFLAFVRAERDANLA